MSNIPENVLVDDCDRPMLEEMGKWFIDTGYCMKKSKNKKLLMHRVIMKPPDDMQVDHINGNRLDNRRCNLRIVTNQQNQWNQTRAKGYSWHRNKNKWQARIVKNKKTIYLGLFDNEQEARQAYLEAKEIYHMID
jgi:hypothetical protein